MVRGGYTADALLAIMVGAAAGCGAFLLIVAIRGLTPGPSGSGRLGRLANDVVGIRGGVAVAAGLLTLLATRWVVAGIGIALLAFSWNGLTGAGAERRALARLEGLATWTESLRDTIAGAVGLEQAIPASMRVAAPTLVEPLARLVDRLHTRMPMPDALRRFADDLDDPGADLIIAGLIINSRLRGPGLRDLLSSLSQSVREELDARRRVNADRRSTRRSVQIVVLVSVGLAVALALLDHKFLAPYDGVVGQLILVIVVAVYASGILWLRRLAQFRAPQRLLAGPAQPAAPAALAQPTGPVPGGQT